MLPTPFALASVVSVIININAIVFFIVVLLLIIEKKGGGFYATFFFSGVF